MSPVCFVTEVLSTLMTAAPIARRKGYLQQHVAVEQFSRSIVRGHYVALLDLHKQHERFAAEWDRNLRLQGFVEAFTDAAIRG